MVEYVDLLNKVHVMFTDVKYFSQKFRLGLIGDFRQTMLQWTMLGGAYRFFAVLYWS